MTVVLHIESSARTSESLGRPITSRILDHLAPTKTITRDLVHPLPQIDAAWVAAQLIAKSDRSKPQADVLKLSDILIGEVKAADTLLIGVPIYNFGIPASLKLWIDLIARPKETFVYEADGPRGLMTGKRAIISMVSGGVPVGSAMDFASPHLVQVMNFIGITDTTIVDAKDDNLDGVIAGL